MVKRLVVVARCGHQSNHLQPSSVLPSASSEAPPGGGKALTNQITPSRLPHQFSNYELCWKGEKGTRTCFEFGDGAEECGGPLGAGVDEADGVVAVVECGLAEGAEQLVVGAAVLDDAAGWVLDADPLVLVLGAGVHEDVVLHGHV